VLTLDDMAFASLALGEGLPEIDADHIAFNGLWHCGHVKNEEIAIPFPAVDGAGSATQQMPSRALTSGWNPAQTSHVRR